MKWTGATESAPESKTLIGSYEMSGEGRGLGEYQKRQRKPVTIRGVTYESHVAAAKALGVSDRTISMAVKRGTQDRVALRKEKTDG